VRRREKGVKLGRGDVFYSHSIGVLVVDYRGTDVWAIVKASLLSHVD
jgi:hypothetical protein